MKKGNMPVQCHANNLQLKEVPAQLKILNRIERHLTSPAINFAKLINLPRNTQLGIHGPVVSILSDMTKIAAALPRNLADGSLCKIKLKRKLAYKGHYQFQDVNPVHIYAAIDILKKMHPGFESKL